MNATTPSQHPDAVYQRMEERIAELEQRLQSMEAESVPWHVIAAAVAAVVPDARIVSNAEVPSQRLWETSGRLRNVSSHQLRNSHNPRFR